MLSRIQKPDVKNLFIQYRQQLESNSVVNESSLRVLTEQQLANFGVNPGHAALLKEAFPRGSRFSFFGRLWPRQTATEPVTCQPFLQRAWSFVTSIYSLKGNPHEQLAMFMPPAPAALPTSVADLQAWFAAGTFKIPVSHWEAGTHQEEKVSRLITAVPPSSVTRLTDFFLGGVSTPAPDAAEVCSSSLIQNFINCFFTLFTRLLEEHFQWKATYNQTETGTDVPATIARSRLDSLVIAVAKHIAVWFGEDKPQAVDQQDAENDLKDKLLDLPQIFMGRDKLPYSLAYTLHGVSARLYAVTFFQNQVMLHQLGKGLTLSSPYDRALMIRYLAKIYALLVCMERQLPVLQASVPHNQNMTHKSQPAPGIEWTRTLIFGSHEAQKTITHFSKYCAFHHTSKQIIERAYKQADKAERLVLPQSQFGPFMVKGKMREKRSADGVPKDTLTVELQPLGYRPDMASSEQDVQHMALSMCLTAWFLHLIGLVYRDWRAPNIVKHLKQLGYMVVDMESVSQADVEFPLHHRLASWGPHALEDGKYTTKSDMYQIGLLIQTYLANLRTRNLHVSNDASQWVESLVVADPGSRLDAKDALQHPWLKDLCTACVGTAIADAGPRTPRSSPKPRQPRVASPVAQPSLQASPATRQSGRALKRQATC